MPLSRNEIAYLEQVVATGRLAEVRIEQGGERVVIGGEGPAGTTADLVPVTAPLAGTVSFSGSETGQRVAAGDNVATLTVLDAKTPVPAPVGGRIVALLAEEGTLVGFGAEVLLIEPEGKA